MATLTNGLLTALIVVPLGILIQRGDYSILTMIGIIVAVLSFFTVLVRILLRKGLPSAPELHGRTMTFWWMVAGFLIALTTPPICSVIMVGLLCALSLHEYFSFLSAQPENQAAFLLSYLSVPLALYFAFYGLYGPYLAVLLVFLLLALPVLLVLQNRTGGTVSLLGFIALGMLFFVIGLGHSYFLLRMGPLVLIYCFFLTEVRDLSSYWLGKGLFVAYRKHPGSGLLKLMNLKIAEKVSPNKAWGAGLLSVALTAALAVWLAPLLPVFPNGHLTSSYAATVGVVIGFFGLMGDLVFSMVKRDIGIKDSGHLLPGGTGIIDRIDSLVLTLPVMFHLIYWHFF